MELNKSFYLTFILCLLSRLTVIKGDPVSSYYKNLRLVSTLKGIAIQMNNSILHIWRMDYYEYDQRMYLSLPDDDCRIKISYGNYIVNSKLNKYQYKRIWNLPQWKFHQNKTFIHGIIKKMYAIEPTYLSLMNFLFQEKPINVFKCGTFNHRNIKTYGCTGITIKYETLVDFYELLQNVSDYHEINPSNVHLFMITDEAKVRNFCMHNNCLKVRNL